MKKVQLSKWLKISIVLIMITIVCVLNTTSCKKPSTDIVNANTDSIAPLTPYSILYPAHFPQMIIPEDNKPFVERIALGKRLYYDPILSNDGRSCANCWKYYRFHLQHPELYSME